MTLRAVIITRSDPLFVPDYLGPVLANPAAKVEAIFIDQRQSPFLSMADIVLMSSPLGFLRLAALKIASATGLLGLFGFQGERDIAALARARGIPVEVVTSGREAALLERMRQIQPDVILSVANSHILPEPVLATARLCALNSHGSLLPAYRGVLTGFWCLYNGEKKSGVTVHRMTSQIDGGDIYGQVEFDIPADETIFSYYRKVASYGGRLWADILEKLDRGDLVPRPNPPATQPMVKRPTRAEILGFRRRGKRFA
ncbi:MAG: methionyl-tRNA formyltransferase [Bacteroidales bacterium]